MTASPRAIIPLALILIAPMVMLWPIWSNPVSAGEDDVVYYYPLRKMVGQSLRAGRLPLYDSREATGRPVMADPQSAVMYPPTWLFAITEAKLAYSLSIFIAFWLAGGGTYLYLRGLALVRPAAVFGAVAFMFCGFMVAHRVHLAMINTACWLPWGLWCIEQTRRSRMRAFLWLAPIGYLAITAGHWPTLIHMGIILTAYMFIRGRPLLPAIGTVAAAAGIALLLAGPQIAMTAELLAQTTRQRIGYAMAGENSFFPGAGVLALFPMIMGSRWPNFYPQQWWGPWHHCEMLGYVGLVTLALAGAGVWSLYRNRGGETIPANSLTPALDGQRAGSQQLRGIVRGWTWIAAGAMVWMLGYYLPTYRLIHMLPVLGVVRCPARMVLAVDMALAVLAAVSMHLLMSEEGGLSRLGDLAARGKSHSGCERVFCSASASRKLTETQSLPTSSLLDSGQNAALSPKKHFHHGLLAKTVRRAATIWLPLAMLAVLSLLAAAGGLLTLIWPERIPRFTGGTWQMLRSTIPANPAVWVPLALVIATGLAVRYWLARPRRRAAVLIVLLLVDLFMLTRFVDMPPAGHVAEDPEISPAARWLSANAPAVDSYRIWGLSDSYHHRPAELLLPKVCQSLGLSTIAGYGPFQSPPHAQLFGFRIFGTTSDWARLIRQNYLLSLYSVRYIIAADWKYRRVIESVTVPPATPPQIGPEVLTGRWRLERAGREGGRLLLRSAELWQKSMASRQAELADGQVYRIALDARGPDGGAANFLQAEVVRTLPDGRRIWDSQLAMTVHPEQIGPQWRHFEWTFQMPDATTASAMLRIHSTSERAIEVRNVSLRRSGWPEPIDLTGMAEGGARVYRKVAELPSRRAGDPPVAIYRNMLCLDRPSDAPAGHWQSQEAAIERLKWASRVADASTGAAPDLSIPMGTDSAGVRELALLSAGGAAGYLSVAVIWYLFRRKRPKCD